MLPKDVDFDQLSINIEHLRERCDQSQLYSTF